MQVAWLPGNFVDVQLGSRINTVSLNKNEMGQPRNHDMGLDWFRMRMRATWVPPPTSLKPSLKGHCHNLISWEGSAPSCFHSLIRSQPPPPCTQVIWIHCNQSRGIFENQLKTKKDSKMYTTRLLQYSTWPTHTLWCIKLVYIPFKPAHKPISLHGSTTITHILTLSSLTAANQSWCSLYTTFMRTRMDNVFYTIKNRLNETELKITIYVPSH